MSRPQPELPGRLVVLEDRPAVRGRQLAGAGDHRLEDRVEVERRADRLADRAQRLELLDRPREIPGARFQLLEEAHVLDGDHRLGGEGLQELDLLVRERPNLGSPNQDGANRHALAQQRGRQRGAVSELACCSASHRELVLALRRQVVDVNRAPIDDRAAA